MNELINNKNYKYNLIFFRLEMIKATKDFTELLQVFKYI